MNRLLTLALFILLANCSPSEKKKEEIQHDRSQTGLDSIQTILTSCVERHNLQTYRNSATVEAIDSVVFEKLKKDYQNDFKNFNEMNSDSLKRFCKNKFPTIFPSDTCIVLKSLTDNQMKICERSSAGDVKGFMTYKFFSFYCDKVILIEEQYEYLGYVVIDIQNGRGHRMSAHPKFYNWDFLYSWDDEYGEISFVNLTQGRGVDLKYGAWKIKEVVGLNDAIAYKLSCGKETSYWITSLM